MRGMMMEMRARTLNRMSQRMPKKIARHTEALQHRTETHRHDTSYEISTKLVEITIADMNV